MWPCVHKPTIYRKTSKSSLLHHPLTEFLLIKTMFFFFVYDLLFSLTLSVSLQSVCNFLSLPAKNSLPILQCQSHWDRVAGPYWTCINSITCMNSKPLAVVSKWTAWYMYMHCGHVPIHFWHKLCIQRCVQNTTPPLSNVEYSASAQHWLRHFTRWTSRGTYVHALYIL